MGKRRTPPGRPTRSGQAAAGAPPIAPVPAAAEFVAAPDPATRYGEPDLHEHLMDSVSPEALNRGSADDDGSAVAAAPGPADPVPGDAAMPAQPATNRPETPALAMTAPEPVVEAESRERAVMPAVPDEPTASASLPMPVPAAWRAGAASGGVPIRDDIEGIGQTLFTFLRGEGTAAVAHLQAMAGVRSPADAIRLQVGEIQRAADASLTCWSDLARRAGRIVAPR